jgi:pre-rRNA-processing protein TSR4
LNLYRYDLGGIPLPYSEKSDLYKKLFPPKSLAGRHVPVVQSNADDEDDDDENSYEKRFKPYPTVPVCPKCNSRRVFEVQLVSSMISYLAPERLSTTGKAPSRKKRSAAEKAKSLEERRKEVEALLQGKSFNSAEGGEVDQAQQGVGMGMEWGSVVVFGCEGDCVGFTEEWVGVEWEEDQ